MGYLFDTCFLIDLVSGDRGAESKAREVDALGVVKAISVVTVHEYLRGIHYLYGGTSKLEEKLLKAESELSAFQVMPYTYEIARRAAFIDAYLAKRGRIISFPDAVIAATAIHYDLTLVTRNTRHFLDIPHLRVERY
ncbi:MAG: type II toxin-antitoxin system VapC family toxin [Thermoprotei archaeon]|nr:MAG: type II toxin-antitoxin system VapC family toxin [Thermoprotei archaeon]RLF20994.1 MAG: type II toxin-antitoxin system VapC family toxin [Thermoprotei archaeon]